jgi:hypothetical protein
VLVDEPFGVAVEPLDPFLEAAPFDAPLTRPPIFTAGRSLLRTKA